MKLLSYFLVFFLISAPVIAKSFKDVVKDAVSAVVHIKHTQKQEIIEITDIRFGQVIPIDREGAGFLISKNIIITNYHVIEGAKPKDIKIMFKDEYKRRKVTIVGFDKKLDIAVLKLTKDVKIKPLKWNTKVYQGQPVFAIGSPQGLRYTVTTGIVSALRRKLNMGIMTGLYQPTIQTDAFINIGNSGGPLFNMKGEVVGVVTFIWSPDGHQLGLNFAIVSSIVKKAVGHIMKSGRFPRPRIGVIFQDNSENFTVKIFKVFDDGPAFKKLKTNDLIYSINGKRIRQLDHVYAVLETIDGGDILNFVLFRDNKKINLSIVTTTR